MPARRWTPGALVLLALTAACAAPQGTVTSAAPPRPPRPLPDSARADSDWVKRTIAGDPYLQQLEPQYVIDSFVGARALAEDAAWSPLDDQFDAALSWQSPVLGDRRPGHPLLDRALSWDLGVRFAYDRSDVSAGGGTTDELTSRTWEISGGLILEPGLRDLVVSPYVGAGLSLVFTDVERNGTVDPFEERDALTGTYVRAGARISLDERRHIGVDVRWLFGADGPVDGVGAGADAATISFLMGARF